MMINNIFYTIGQIASVGCLVALVGTILYSVIDDIRFRKEIEKEWFDDDNN